jgi:hypothetical protein
LSLSFSLKNKIKERQHFLNFKKFPSSPIQQPINNHNTHAQKSSSTHPQEVETFLYETANMLHEFQILQYQHDAMKGQPLADAFYVENRVTSDAH